MYVKVKKAKSWAFVFLLISLALVLASSCNRAAAPADSSITTPGVTSSVTVTADSSPIETADSAGATAYPGPNLAATSVPAVNTAYPGPTNSSQPTPTNLPLNSSTPYPTPSAIPLNIISQVVLNCTPQDGFAECYDETLRIEFEYPIDWDEIEATLRTGDTGYAYDYAFSSISPEMAFLLMAGGRSEDFTEGRGGILTDFNGYDDLSQGGCASIREDYPICEEIQPNVVLFMKFPEAKNICDLVPGVLFSPLAIVEINLPANPTINGFRFISPFLSPLLVEALNTDIRDILGYTPETGATTCDSASQVEFDGRIAELVKNIKANMVDSDTTENVDSIRHIAESILFLR